METPSDTTMWPPAVLLVVMGVIVILGLIAICVSGKSWSDGKRSPQTIRE